jgi:predicted acetyltransferase
VTGPGEPGAADRHPAPDDRRLTSDDRRLTPDDLEAYLRLREGSFGYPGRSDEVIATFLTRLPRSLGAFVAGDLASSVTVHAYRVFVAGVEVPVGGMAGVQTAPEHRRGGHAARLMRRALDEGRAEGQGWSLLYPFDAAFYRRFGWVTVPTGVPLQLPPEALPAGSAAARALLVRLGHDDAGLRAAYARFAPTRSFLDSRAQGPWDVWEDLAAPPGSQVLRYASDDAFLVVRLQQEESDPRLDVLDLGWCDAEGREAVFAAIAGFRGHAGQVRIELPWDDPVATDRGRTSGRTARHGAMVRVADAALALAPLRAVTDDDVPLDLPPVTVRLVDAFAPWNEGVWRLTPGPDACGVARAAGAVEATLDVRGLALLLAGAAAPGDLRRLGLVEGDGRALATVAALAGGRTPYRSPLDRF